MRILVVEDQLIILEGIKKMISDEIQCEIDTVQSAELALDHIKRHAVPDVIISDIVMSGMDGLDFIAAAKPWLPYSQFLILSGYDWFQFAQRAIQLGVTDYLLKPIQRKLLFDALNKIELRLEEQYNQRSTFCMTDFQLLQLGQQTAPIFPEIERREGVCVAFYSVRQVSQRPECNLPGCYLIGKCSENTLYMLLISSDVFDEVHNRLLQHFEGKGVSFGISRVGDATQAFAQCAYADDNRFFVKNGQNREMDMGVIQQLDDALKYVENRRENICQVIFSALHAMADMTGPAATIRKFSQGLLDRLLGMENDFDVYKTWYQAERYESYLEKLRDRLEVWIQGVQGETIIFRIKSYVNAHCRSPLTVKSVANAVSMSPNYISYLFKKETSESLSSYIRNVQMKTAYNLIQNTDLRIYEIAEQLGYADEKHFSALFRSAYHISPNDLRKNSRCK